MKLYTCILSGINCRRCLEEDEEKLSRYFLLSCSANLTKGLGLILANLTIVVGSKRFIDLKGSCDPEVLEVLKDQRSLFKGFWRYLCGEKQNYDLT